MAVIEWDDGLFSIGIGKIDEQHKKWIELINVINDSIGNSQNVAILGKVFQDMVDYCDYHFREEEELMQNHKYPEYEAHKQKHEKFTEMAISYRKNLMNGEMVSRLEVILNLVEWLKKHIQVVDREFGRFVLSGEKPQD